MTLVEKLAEAVCRISFDDLSPEDRRLLKTRVLDTLGCAIGAVEGEPVRLVRAQIEEFGSSSLCGLIGGGTTSPERAALYNSALVRYLDFNDSFLARGETCHPSDNLGAVLAAAEYAGFHTRPMAWETVVRKFERLSEPYTPERWRRKIVETVAELESTRIRDLVRLLSHVRIPDAHPSPTPSTAPRRSMPRRIGHDHTRPEAR